MIVKMPLVLAICIVWIRDAEGASYSKVYVQSVPENAVEYVQYSAPAVSLNGQRLAQLTAGPVGSVVPYPANYVSPCGSPCTYSSQVAPIAPSATIVQYQPQSLPVVVAPAAPVQARSEPSGYEYSYVVYDEQTGDHKAQREFSDGSVVRGGYSFLQPNGLVREVQYIADDSQGFNAVVKNFLPATVEGNKNEQEVKSEPAPPCQEVQNEQLKEDESYVEEKQAIESSDAEPSHENLVIQEDQEEHKDEPEPFNENQGEAIHEETQNEEQDAPEEQSESRNGNSNSKEKPLELIPKVDIPNYAKSSEETVETNVKQEERQIDIPKNGVENSNILVPYNDIIRCVQAAINGANVVSPQKPESPLTYIILNKPC